MANNSDGRIILSTKIDTTGIKDGTRNLRSEAMKLAAAYRKAGMTQSEAQKQAYRELGITKEKTEGLTQKIKECGKEAAKSGRTVKSALASTGKAMLAGGAVMAATIIAVTKQATDAYADYEQLIGGVETLFKDSASKVARYAEDAFYTAGLPANKYMETVTGFSAGLIKSLGGDTEKAADVANTAMVDMADNANKMGTELGLIQNAYQGFAKQNYTMLDNLKLGYGGTKTEMERLLKDAEAFSGVKYDINNLADVYNAIHAIQEKMGIAGTTAAEAEKTIAGSGAMAKAAWNNVLVAISGGGDLDKAINNLVFAISKYFENLVPVVQRSILGIGAMVERIAPSLVQNVAIALIKSLPNLLNAVYQMIIGLAKGIYHGIAALFTGHSFTNEISAQLSDVAQSTEKAAEAEENLADGIKAARNEAKKSLAGFDELNKLQGDNSESESSGADWTGTVTSTIGGADVSTDVVGKIDANLAAIMEVVGGALAAVGVVLLFSGSILWGIGFITAGAAMFGVAAATTSREDVAPTITSALIGIMGIVSGALLALGVILIMAGATGMGIGFVLAGASALGVSIYAVTEFSTDPIRDTLLLIETIAGGALLALGMLLLHFGGATPLSIGLIMAGAATLAIATAQIIAGAVSEEVAAWIYGITAIVSGALLVIGIIMLFAGHISPLSIGLVVVGAVGLASTVAINWNAIVTALQGPIGKIVAIVSGALLVLGAILTFSGANIILGIGLMIAGAAGLATTAAVNWDSIVSAMQGSVGKIVAIISGALLVIGIILLFTGVGIPLGLGLILAGAAGLAATVAFNWNSIVDSIKGVWDKIKEFWNKHIAKWFTKEHWLKLAKSIGNGLIAGIEGAINGVISMFETMLNWIVGGLNKISFDVPDWVPGLGGKTFGFNLAKVQFGRVSIPRLAKGAVIPPNREFMAVLGDQKHGTNIEAPLTTIQEAVAIVMEDMIQSNIAGHEAIIAVLREILEAVLGIEIGDDTIAHAVARYNAKMAVVRGG